MSDEQQVVCSCSLDEGDLTSMGTMTVQANGQILAFLRLIAQNMDKIMPIIQTIMALFPKKEVGPVG